DTGSADALTESPTTPIGKPRRRRPDRVSAAANLSATLVPSPADFHNNNNNNNNNNNVKNERLSPGTPDTSSRSVTPSHPDTPPAPDANPMLHISGRNYSDFMRSLAAKYNNANPNEYFSRNGFPPPLDPRYKQSFPLMPALQTPNKEDPTKKPEFPQVLNPFAVAGSAMFPPLIDMSSTQALLAMVRTAKEAELQGLLKNAKRSDPSSPLDLSAAAAPPPTKRPRNKTPSTGSVGSLPKRAESESPKLHEDISHWTVEDVCNFVQSIDICAEYALVVGEERSLWKKRRRRTMMQRLKMRMAVEEEQNQKKNKRAKKQKKQQQLKQNRTEWMEAGPASIEKLPTSIHPSTTHVAV
ncbi:PREDICTED: rho GTPase-activating protein gacO-like, partial [Nicrophorus vespilloides]|uniref:Rho GTPase-activating protein gacO-like n=1 Tax=Nicrophorus vespilloides TaxID=110193 RepID=A0ABM1N1A5_NICVS